MIDRCSSRTRRRITFSLQTTKTPLLARLPGIFRTKVRDNIQGANEMYLNFAVPTVPSLLVGDSRPLHSLIIAIAVLVSQFNQSATAAEEKPANQNCFGHATAEMPQGNLKVASSTRWEPVGGEILFTLNELPAEPKNVTVWFNWQNTDSTSTCVPSPRVLFVGKSTALGDATKFIYNY